MSEDDILLELQKDNIIPDVIDYLKKHGPTNIETLVKELNTDHCIFFREIMKETIQSACDQDLVIYSKKLNKLLGEEVVCLTERSK